jgi:hypothetical protein
VGSSITMHDARYTIKGYGVARVMVN